MKSGFSGYVYSLMTDRRAGWCAAVLKGGLFLLSLIYRFLLITRAGMYACKILPVYRSSQKVISVGNVVMGGVGKTPLVAFLARGMVVRGVRPVVITRGYMPRRGVESDEARMLQELLPGLEVYAGADRAASIKKAEQTVGQAVYILDDGFQHWRVARDLDIVVVDAALPFGNHCLLPRGILREPLACLSRADIIVISRVDAQGAQAQQVRNTCLKLNSAALIVEAVQRPSGITNLVSGEKRGAFLPIQTDVVMLCGIGSPENFRSSLERLGAVVKKDIVFRDHHLYTKEEIAALVKECRSSALHTIVTTHKDAVKLRPFFRGDEGIDIFVLDVEMKIVHGENEFFSRIDRLLHS